ncbi:MAG: 2,3-bisphosphoglycerate-independent phosphoglycerate mutase [Balneolaceae bacterium]
MPRSSSKALLIVIDGFGIADVPEVSAIERAETPCLDSLLKNYPSSQLSASGPDVGLPDGQFGNSEVGHLNIGAGRVVWQELSRINKDIDDKGFFENRALAGAFRHAAEKGRIHLMGLFSDGGVHSHNSHLFALLKMAKMFDIEHVYIHAFTDGRDTSPHGGLDYYYEFREKTEETGTGELASITGRYFAMDRDNRWERTEKAYRMLVSGEGEHEADAEEVFKKSYSNGTTDEFLLPHSVSTAGDSRIRPGDAVIFFNLRGDRARQITKALLRFDEVPFETAPLDLHLTTFTSYDETFSRHVDVAYPPVELKNTLGYWVSRQKIPQLRIAETEKYPHVTYFFNGGLETPNEAEERIMIPSPDVATYDLQPEMSAHRLSVKLREQIKTGDFGLIVVNFANADMVGHTGVMEAAVKAVETVDAELKNVVESATGREYKILIISDHGNADCMIKADGSSHTAHTKAPVPAILIGEENAVMHNGTLADVAPTLLKMMGLSKPDEMTGTPLF